MIPNTIVPCYRDYKNNRDFEGYCVLIEKVSVTDTFYSDDEEVDFLNSNISTDTKGSSNLSKTSHTIRKNDKLNSYIRENLNTQNKNVLAFATRMRRVAGTKRNVHSQLSAIITEYRKKFANTPARVNNLLILETSVLIKFFQQEKLGTKWRPTIYHAERWLVEFHPQRHPTTGRVLFNSPFRTHRKFREVVCISPSDEGRGSQSLSKLTTYNLVSSLGYN